MNHRPATSALLSELLDNLFGNLSKSAIAELIDHLVKKADDPKFTEQMREYFETQMLEHQRNELIESLRLEDQIPDFGPVGPTGIIGKSGPTGSTGIIGKTRPKTVKNYHNYDSNYSLENIYFNYKEELTNKNMRKYNNKILSEIEEFY